MHFSFFEIVGKVLSKDYHQMLQCILVNFLHGVLMVILVLGKAKSFMINVFIAVSQIAMGGQRLCPPIEIWPGYYLCFLTPSHFICFLSFFLSLEIQTQSLRYHCECNDRTWYMLLTCVSFLIELTYGIVYAWAIE